ncbi:restriction endonuclease type II-like protein [Thelephora terrestris]|uniref:Restriction endonuclease type II-like protein n=1 Tax=Thelephora terrestris TaxID=56493 RepID=A0A9P6LCC3_9AGAM|nr:restriction endonuclease type II-like protein [Thelephora terrestris]
MSGTDVTSDTGTGPSRQPPKPPVKQPPVVMPGSGNNVIAAVFLGGIDPQRQRKNPLLECIKQGREFGDIVADFQVGRTTGILFLSLKYHRLHPEYISQRIDSLGSSYNLRILLILCDISEHQVPIRELTKKCLINNITIIVAWTNDEAGLYISSFKKLEHRPPTMIKERVDKDHSSVFRSALTSISKVNKTDVQTLRSSIGSFADIANAPAERLEKLPGFGQVKVKRLRDAFDKPFQGTKTIVPRHMTQPQPLHPSPPAGPQDIGSDILVSADNL